MMEDALKKIVKTLDEQGGTFILSKREHWTAGIEFGEEEPGSDMAGGAAYGVGDSALEAICDVAKDLL